MFGVCLMRREVVLIHDTSDRALSTYLPPWWADVTLGVKSFVLVPIADRPNVVDTLLFFGWPEKRRVQLARGHISLLQQLFVKPKT